MERRSPLSLVLILLLIPSTILSQQPQSGREECEGEEFRIGVPGNHAYGFKLSTPPVVSMKEVGEVLPARGGEKIDWGLALSGGGLRSSAFNIGVMKVLYDRGILDRIDVISSVSGGSYASYWLFTSYSQNKGLRFGEAAFAPDVFVKNMCEFQGRGNFFTNTKAFKSLFRSNTGAFRQYENAIIRSFGNGESYETELGYLNRAIKETHAPYFIVNATLDSSALGGLGRVFEITPTHMGNPVIGFYNWEQNGNRTLRLSESVTVSGAALEFKLKRPIPNFSPHIINAKNLRLSDGGHSENLGALALIRRGIKNVIITDAEHDYDYKFKAYSDLKKLLYGMGIEFRVPDIEDFMANRKKKSAFDSAVSMGYAKSLRPGGGNSFTRIFYLKMSRPHTILPAAAAECDKENNPASDRTNDCDILRDCEKNTADKTAYEKGDCLRVSRNRKAEAICPDRCWNCDGLAGFSLGRDMYVNIVQRYSYTANCTGKSRRLPRLSSTFDFRYKFPQITTWDQNYYRDQLEAFVGLGYLQSWELKESASVEGMMSSN